MIKFYLKSFCIFLISIMICHFVNGQTYVKQDATGANDGSSWVNAYSNLNDALGSTTSGDIWVASGLYIPTAMVVDSATTFKISNPINIYGSFIGTETNIDQRDIVANPTTLSGDLNSDDIPNDFSVNKGDNVQHVIVVDSLIGATITIDGFVLSGGNSSANTQGANEFFYRGGGIFSYSTVNIKNCIFSQNFAGSGAGVYISPLGGSGNDSSFEGCTFSNNSTSSQSAGIFLFGLDNILIDDCTFSNNTTIRGVLYPNSCTNINVIGCTFQNNSHVFTDGFGGVLFNWQSTGVNFTDCEFRNNIGGNGGVMYHDGRNVGMDANNLVFENCLFEDNTATDFGGGVLYAWRSSYTINNCTFINNLGTNGSHIFNTATEDKEVVISNSSFSGGASFFGGAMSCYGENSTYIIMNNTFSGGTAETSGGALICGFKADITISDCDFSFNEAGVGGAIYVQNDSTNVSIFNSSFDANVANGEGGAISFSGAGDYIVDGSEFTSNTADRGGAISASEFKGDPVAQNASLMLTNTIIDFNLAQSQGGALNLNNIDATIYNTQLSNNFNLSANGAGGAISQNVGDSLIRSITIVNSTLVNNIAPIGAGIAQFTGLNESVLNLNIQNTILFNPDGTDYEIEGGTPTVLSLGGNLSGDNSANSVLTNGQDQTAVNDLFFVDIDDDFHLTELSPAINVGVDVGAPTNDLEGNPRLGQTDAGAYEFQMEVATKETIISNLALKVLPNPVADVLRFELENNWSGAMQVSIFNLQGQELEKIQIRKTNGLLQGVLNVENLARGVYDLLVSNGNQAVTVKFVKM
jgi:parallel beta-helix repeat protein